MQHTELPSRSTKVFRSNARSIVAKDRSGSAHMGTRTSLDQAAGRPCPPRRGTGKRRPEDAGGGIGHKDADLRTSTAVGDPSTGGGGGAGSCPRARSRAASGAPSAAQL